MTTKTPLIRGLIVLRNIALGLAVLVAGVMASYYLAFAMLSLGELVCSADNHAHYPNEAVAHVWAGATALIAVTLGLALSYKVGGGLWAIIAVKRLQQEKGK